MKKYNLDLFRILLLAMLGSYFWFNFLIIINIQLGKLLIMIIFMLIILGAYVSYKKTDAKYLFISTLISLVVLEIYVLILRGAVLGDNTAFQSDINWDTAIYSYAAKFTTPFFIVINLLVLFVNKPQK